MNKKVLFVDDDAKILASIRRNLSALYDVSLAGGGAEGLEKLAAEGPFAAVVSDLKMPDLNGLAFLAGARKAHPDTVRVMLTGYADLEAAVTAVNEGQIFRFLTKPCTTQLLASTLDAAIEQYRLVVSERELLEGTLRGSIKMLMEVLSLLKPEVWGRVSRIVPMVRKLAARLKAQNPWQIVTAAQLAQLGYIILPDEVLQRRNEGKLLSGDQWALYARHPKVAAELISNIPRMDEVARIITYQEKNYDGSGLPADDVRKTGIPLGARILRVALDFDDLASEAPKNEAMDQMRRRVGLYDPNVVAALEEVLGDEAKYHIVELSVTELRDEMILMEDICLSRGANELKVLTRGQQISRVTREYLRKYLDQGYIGGKVKVIEPFPFAGEAK